MFSSDTRHGNCVAGFVNLYWNVILWTAAVALGFWVVNMLMPTPAHAGEASGDIAVMLVGFLCAPLSLYLLAVPFVLVLLMWFAVQNMTTRVCRMFGWRRPNWAVSHTERPGFYPYEGA
jgi:hypothetical protein